MANICLTLPCKRLPLQSSLQALGNCGVVFASWSTSLNPSIAQPHWHNGWPQLYKRSRNRKPRNNKTYRALRTKIARQDKYWSLVSARGAEREREALYNKLGGDVEPDWDQRDRMERWLAAAQTRRRRAWAGWLRCRRQRSSGRIFKWAQRHRAEGYGGLTTEPDGVLQTIVTKLEAATEAWRALRMTMAKPQPTRAATQCWTPLSTTPAVLPRVSRMARSWSPNMVANPPGESPCKYETTPEVQRHGQVPTET